MIYNRPEYWLAQTETVVPYLTFSSPNSFTLAVEDTTKHWDGTVEYSTDTSVWATWDGTTMLSSTTSGSDNVLYLRGTGNTKIGYYDEAVEYDYIPWVINGTDVRCNGNIETLLDYATVKAGQHPTMGEKCFAGLFKGCTALITSPELPAMTLASECYYYMFSDCTSLTQAPSLPATTLADNCYNNMFNGCTSLKLSSTKTDEYTQAYRVPSSGDGTTATDALTNMFSSTGGTFTGTPSINTTYYLSSDNIVVRETEIATLNGYVGSMIDTAIGEYADTAEYIIHSSTSGSTKKFKIIVDDSGIISATEVT